MSLRIFLRNYVKLNYLQFKYCCISSRQFSSADEAKQKAINVAQFPTELIRNFSVIAHIDHGKSTLSDRFLEMAGLMSKEKSTAQYLDKLQVEKERGITIKAQTCSLVFNDNGKDYLLNLIDTPGHVDFSFEVYRSLPSCQGALLLVDATKGVQAQTIAHFNQALLMDVNIIPVINKIDMENADIKATREQFKSLFSFNDNEILEISAKTGLNCESLISTIINKIPPPSCNRSKPLKAFYFDSWFDENEGVTALVSILDGSLKTGDYIVSLKSKKNFLVKNVGIFFPEQLEQETLYAGQVGFFTANIRNLDDVKLGDCFVHSSTFDNLSKSDAEYEDFLKSIPDLPKPKPSMYASIYPCEQGQAKDLEKSLLKLSLNDASVTIEKENSAALGAGFRLGFLGLLHMEVFSERLENEYDAPTVVTTPSVPYKVYIKGAKNIKSLGSDMLMISNPHQLPSMDIIERFEEPLVTITIISPNQYYKSIISLLMDRRGKQIETSSVDQNRLLVKFLVPLNEVVIDLFEVLKNITSGYASFDYEEAGYQENKIVKVDFSLNGKPIHELSTLVPKASSKEFAKRMCQRIKENLTPQQFKIDIVGLVQKRPVARASIEALRKDVTAKLYGGDLTRAQKLLSQQKKGKERLRMIGKIPVTRESFIKILRA